MAFIRAMAALSKPGMYLQKGEEGRVFYAFNHYVDFLDDLGRAKCYIDCRVLCLVLSTGTYKLCQNTMPKKLTTTTMITTWITTKITTTKKMQNGYMFCPKTFP